MVKLVSSLFLSALIIVPTLASQLPDFEIRDVSHLLARELSESEAAVFAREMEGLFARQQDPQYVDLARRHHHKFNFGNFAKGAVGTVIRRGIDDENDNVPARHHRYSARQLHAAHTKHELVERDFDDDQLLDRDLDYFYDLD